MDITVGVIIFFLGVLIEKYNEEQKNQKAVNQAKLFVVASIFEIYNIASLTKKELERLEGFNKKNKEELKSDGTLNMQKTILTCLPVDFFEKAKEYNFFKFDFKQAAQFIALKSSVERINSAIEIYNNDFNYKMGLNEAETNLNFNKLENLVGSINYLNDKICEGCLDLFKHDKFIKETIKFLNLDIEKLLKEKKEQKAAKIV
ncbi:MAG: hypothetical protein KAI72_06830 [Candidatus Pacebacteria bacterium]|nr:hypothetical protein [Candidatus Paceibacterota bacterium]